MITLYLDYETGRFTSTDMLWEKYAGWSPYHYCGNNPIGFSDGNGLLPSDKFSSPEIAAHDFGKNYIPLTKQYQSEFGSNIYKFIANGEEYFSYTIPEIGDNKNVTHTNQIPENSNYIMEIHTHPSNNIFSKDKDIETANKNQIIVNCVTQNGQIWRYTPKEDGFGNIKQTHDKVNNSLRSQKPIPYRDEVDEETNKLTGNKTIYEVK